MVYQTYLSGFGESKLDDITKLVGKQTEFVLQLFDDKSFIEDNIDNTYIKLFYKNTYVGRIIEGCNAISVIILFVSFIVAFSGKLKQTLLYILAGSVLIYLLNILRIVLLVVLVYNYPSEEHLLHGVLFPLIIYGIVFILWVIWVNKFSKYASKTAK